MGRGADLRAWVRVSVSLWVWVQGPLNMGVASGGHNKFLLL